MGEMAGVNVKTAPESRTVEFGEIYNRSTQRFMPASVPKQVSRKVLAISQVVLAFQHLHDCAAWSAYFRIARQASHPCRMSVRGREWVQMRRVRVH
jgi:hypothetical protein